MSFTNDLGYFEGETPMDDADRKCLQRLINFELLMESRSREERKVIFGRFRKILSFLSLICLFVMYLL